MYFAVWRSIHIGVHDPVLWFIFQIPVITSHYGIFYRKKNGEENGGPGEFSEGIKGKFLIQSRYNIII